VDALALLIRLEENHYINFQIRTTELREQPQLQVAKRTITTNLDKAKRQKRSPVPVPVPVHSPIPLHHFLKSPKSKSLDHVSEQTRLEWDNTSTLRAIQEILNYAKKGKSKQSSPQEATKDLTMYAMQSVLNQVLLRSLTEPLSELVSKRSLPAIQRGGSLFDSSNVPS